MFASVSALGCGGGVSTGGSGGGGGRDGGAGDSSSSNNSGSSSSSSGGGGAPQCNAGNTQPCYTGDPATKGIGACTLGTQVCTAQGMWDPTCVGEGKPSADTCDGIDNDCNGTVDDGLPPLMCGLGACAATAPACNNGKPGTCTPGNATPEVCDGIDNNCDGTVDEGLPPLMCGLGACAVMAPACNNGQPGMCVPGNPMPEACDGIDNDCNGIIDDGLGFSSCGVGACAVTVQKCMNGQPQQCVPLPAMPEVCDGIDNNCNGTIDEGNPGGGQACNTGLLGACAAGTTACSNGMIACNQNVQPSAETCDGIDNNCNGTADEGNPGGGQACSTGLLGVCAAGTTACSNGMIACNQNVQPSVEVCGDNLDNNCNGQVNEACPVVCGNGVLDAGEVCDDGNNLNNDACTNTCVLGPLAVFGNAKTYTVNALNAIPEVFTQPAGAQWGVPSSLGVIITSNDGGLGPHPDYNAHLNAGAHVLVIGGTMDVAYTTWIGGYVNTDGTTSWHQSTGCVSDWNKVGVHAITQFMPATWEFSNLLSSYHMHHFAAAQPANTTLLGVSCESASNYIFVTRRYPTGGTFTYIPFDIGNYGDAATQTGFFVPLLKGYLKYVRSPH